MLYSLCVKSNNVKILNYLLKRLDGGNIITSKNKFKIYDNIIIHYSGNEKDNFYNILSDYITDVILEFYESNLIKKIINVNYFYFSDSEKSEIYKTSIKYLKNDIIQNKGTIFLSVLNYILSNKVIILDGFVNFRLKDYIKILDSTVDIAVDDFLVQREYYEFIDLLKTYIDSNDNTVGLIHVLYNYNDEDSILLDKHNKIIDIDDSLLNAKYLSDISFSKNDHILNTLLTLIPEKIYIHLLSEKDEFINTLELIFDNRVIICNDCNFCKNYKKDNKIVVERLT